MPAAGCLHTVPSNSPSLPHPSSTPARPPTCSVDAAGFDPALLLSPLSDFPPLGCDTPESPDSLASGSHAVVRRCPAIPDECAPCCMLCCVRACVCVWGGGGVHCCRCVCKLLRSPLSAALQGCIADEYCILAHHLLCAGASGLLGWAAGQRQQAQARRDGRSVTCHPTQQGCRCRLAGSGARRCRARRCHARPGATSPAPCTETRHKTRLMPATPPQHTSASA